MIKLSFGCYVNTKLITVILPSYIEWQYMLCIKFMWGQDECLYYTTSEDRQKDLDLLLK